MHRLIRPSRGFTLIEVLVALIVLVLGVLGAAGMTLNALRDTKQSSTRSQAVSMAYELADIMRANKGSESVFTSNTLPASVSSCYTAAGCPPTEMAQNEYREWKLKVGSASSPLPNSSVIVCHDATNLNLMGTASNCDNSPASPLVVKMTWDEKLNDGTFVSSSASSPPRLVMPIQP